MNPLKRVDRWRRLGWYLIRQRVLYYYYPDYQEITDRHYDKLEAKYKQLSKLLGKKPVSILDVEPDRTKGSVQMVESVILADIKLGILRKGK